MKTLPIFFVAAVGALGALYSFGAAVAIPGISLMLGLSELRTDARECERSYNFQDLGCFKRVDAKAKALATQGAALSGMAGGNLGE